MAEISKETTTTQGNNINPVVNTTTKNTSVKNTATNSQTVEYLVYFFFGVLEILLTFRLILKLTGASITSAFVSLVYGITRIFTLPFEGIFKRGIAQGAETTSIFEPSTLVAIAVYAVIVWGIIKLIRIFSGEKQIETN